MRAVNQETGAAIVKRLEHISATLDLDPESFRFDETTKTLTVEDAGHGAEVIWDTLEPDRDRETGELIYIDEEGEHVRESQILVVPDLSTTPAQVRQYQIGYDAKAVRHPNVAAGVRYRAEHSLEELPLLAVDEDGKLRAMTREEHSEYQRAMRNPTGALDLVRLTGEDAIAAAERGATSTLHKYADPTQGERSGLSLSEAREIAAEDPGLVWCYVTRQCS